MKPKPIFSKGGSKDEIRGSCNLCKFFDDEFPCVICENNSEFIAK